MRTAKTIGLKHDRKTEVLIAGRLVGIDKQLDAFRKIKGLKEHPDFCEVEFQSSDGSAQLVRLMSPEDAKSFAERQKKANETHQKHTVFTPNKKQDTDLQLSQYNNVTAEIKRLKDAGKEKESEAIAEQFKNVIATGKKILDEKNKAATPQPAPKAADKKPK